jgi:hypothetical protein
MKKIISLFVFAAALIWTWNLFHSAPSSVAFETHADIQNKLAAIIQESLIAKKPAASEFQVVRLWTETISDNKVRAVFAYKFKDKNDANETTEQTIEGEAVLHREPSTFKQEDHWVIQSVKTTNDLVNFNEGSTVSPNMLLPATIETPIPAPTPAVAEPNKKK